MPAQLQAFSWPPLLLFRQQARILSHVARQPQPALHALHAPVCIFLRRSSKLPLRLLHRGMPGIHELVWGLSFISFYFLYPSTFNILEVRGAGWPPLVPHVKGPPWGMLALVERICLYCCRPQPTSSSQGQAEGPMDA